jgi:ESCRT-I complex subunit VPS37
MFYSIALKLMRGSGRNIEMRDELLALRETTAQVYSHAEALKMRWADIEKAQASLYQVS